VQPHIGARIKQLREAAGLRASDLADLVGMDATALSKIENDRRNVKSTELADLAKALGVSPLALLADEPILSKLSVAARRAGNGLTMGAAYDELMRLSELHVVLSDAGIHASPDLASVPDVRGQSWFDGAEALARWANTKLPITSDGDQRFASLADKIEEVLSLDVFVQEFEGDALSGAAITDRSFPLLFVNSTHPRPRCLFTLAHELGHVLANHNGDGITLDRELSGSTEDERMANAFAASFLMPSETIRSRIEEDGREPSTLVALTYELGVSFESLIYRLHNLRIINAEGRDQLMSVNWRQLALLLNNPSLRGNVSKFGVSKLQSRDSSRPARRPPGVLLRRASSGYVKGVIGVQPLADLVGTDSELMLDQFSQKQDIDQVIGILKSDFSQQTDETPEDLFSGTPF